MTDRLFAIRYRAGLIAGLLSFAAFEAASAQETKTAPPVTKAEEAARAQPEIQFDYKKLERSATAPAPSRSQPGGEALAKPGASLPSALRVEEPRERQQVAPPPETLTPAPPETPLETQKSDSRTGRDAEQGEGRRRPRGRDDVDRGPGRGRPGGGGVVANRTIADEAARAAQWAVRKMIDERALGQYYRLGVWQGLREALDRSSSRHYDYDQGSADGDRDPRAERMGADSAGQLAEERAEQAALAAFDDEVADLDQEPRRSLRPPVEAYPRGLLRVPAPRLEDVFAETPFDRFQRQRYVRSIPDPLQLYRFASYGDVFDRGWNNSRQAFELWVRDGDSRLWSRLDRVQQDYFRRSFDAEFDYLLRRELARASERAYREGYDDGWDYGAYVGAEYRYRQGYQEAFNVAAERAARSIWSRTWPEAFERAYGDAYRRWLNTVEPELRGHTLRDTNDDGLLEPGEELTLELEIWNRGGADGRVEVLISGNDIEGGGRESIGVRRRQSVRERFDLRIDPRTLPRTESAIDIRLDEKPERIPFRVSRPLELEREVHGLRIDALAGRVELDLGLRNLGRERISGRVEIEVGGRRVPAEELAVVPPRGRLPVAAVVDGLRAIDLLAGGLELEIEALGRDGAGRRPGPGEREVLHDRLQQRLPALAENLGDGQLVAYWVALQRGELRRDQEDGQRAIELLARRMEADWQRQRDLGGNPYKDDLEGRRPRTALGELVAAQRGTGRPARPELQSALVQRLQRLAGELPGTHPFLRGSFEKLVKQLG
jgi:hypothetical protein